MKRIYIDVTQSLTWRGRATGIIRVMDELTVRFMNDDRFDPVMVSWDEHAGKFMRVDLKAVLSKRVVIEKTTVANSPQISRLRRYGSRLLREIPAARRVYLKLKNTKNRSRTIIKSQKHQSIEAGATLFMPHGGVWGVG